MKMDILAMINVVCVTMVVVVILYLIAYVNDVSDDFVVFAILLKFSACGVADICSRDVLSYAVPYNGVKRNEEKINMVNVKTPDQKVIG